MARAKNTDRAEARRRHREETRAASAPLNQIDDDPQDAAAQEQRQVSGLRGMFRMPDFRDDLQTFPGMIVHSPKLWIPFVMLLVSFVLAVLLTQGTTNPDGSFTSSIFPTGVESLVSLYVQLTLPPTALFVFFIGGFLAPRSSWLIGAVLGLVDGILWSLLFVISPTAQVTTAGSTTPNAKVTSVVDFLAIILVAVVVGILAASFASWYRNFLRSSQERARQNRAAREQQQRLKAKEDARTAREAQRQTAAASRQTKNVTPSGTSASTTPPSKR